MIDARPKCAYCKGECCRDFAHKRFPHKAAEHYWHACAYCDDGAAAEEKNETVEALRAEVARLRERCTEDLIKGFEMGKAAERAAVVSWLVDPNALIQPQVSHRIGRREPRGGGAAVVAWLREQAEIVYDHTLRLAAGAIERGVHRGEHLWEQK